MLGRALPPPVHVFTYADRLHPNLCTLASSVEAAGGHLNVLDLDRTTGPWGSVPRPALKAVARSLAAHARQPATPEQRQSSPSACRTEAECASDPQGLAKIRKFFALRPHLSEFGDEEVLLFVDGYDVVVEAASLQQLRDAFEQFQRKLGPLVAPSGGPVIFNGEANCWPFPHQGGSWTAPDATVVSGDYRPDYLYRFGNRTFLRGDRMCDYWYRQARLREGMGFASSMEGAAPHAPFPNSGVFMGRAGSVRRLLDLAAETLRLFGDFEDQGLVYATALMAASARRPWVPLWVDAGGEFLGALHGQDLDAMALQLRAPRVCDFDAKVARGFFFAGSTQRAGLGADGLPRTRRWPAPLVAHFNGDKKPDFEQACHQSARKVGLATGMPQDTCRVIDYSRRSELFFTEAGTTTHMRAVSLPRPPASLSPSKVLGLILSARTIPSAREKLRALAPPPQVVAEIRMSTDWDVDAPGLSQCTRPVDAAIVPQNATSCTRGRAGYCSLFAALRAAWSCVRTSSACPHPDGPWELSHGAEGPRCSAGLLWAEFSGPQELWDVFQPASPSRHERECGAAAESARAAEPQENLWPCASQAVVDFLFSLSPWEVTYFRWAVGRRRPVGVILAVKQPAA